MRRCADPPSGRLDFLDGLRGVAVGLVLLQHVGEQAFPAVRSLTGSTVALGQLGVMVFFLCSGFIIPASLERARREPGRRPALRAFWISRVCRLYPLYWGSLGAAGLLVALGRYTPPQPLSAGDWLANAAMLQLPAGAPHALGLYWTLAFEMVFYVAVSLLFVAGLHRRSVALSLVASAGCLGAAVLAGPVLGGPAPLGLFCLATMFLGTVAHRWHTGEVGVAALLGCTGAALAAGTALLVSAFESPAADGTAFTPMLTAWLGAYAVAGAGLALRGRAGPAWLRRLGTISYSVYLVQALVLIVVPALPSPLLAALLWTVLVIGLSELSYRVVELPAQRLGRRLAAGRRPAGTATRLLHLAPEPAGGLDRPATAPQRLAV